MPIKTKKTKLTMTALLLVFCVWDLKFVLFSRTMHKEAKEIILILLKGFGYQWFYIKTIKTSLIIKLQGNLQRIFLTSKSVAPSPTIVKVLKPWAWKSVWSALQAMQVVKKTKLNKRAEPSWFVGQQQLFLHSLK